MERITERNYTLVSAKYEKEQLEIDTRLEQISNEISDKTEQGQNISDFIGLIKSYQGITELSAPIVNALIDKITVLERVKDSDGTVTQEIKIYYKFVGTLADIHINAVKQSACLDNKVCDCCGATYTPKSGKSKYCITCREKIRKEQSNESKRRSREKLKIANCIIIL